MGIDEKRSILEQVASGAISPEEASARLDALHPELLGGRHGARTATALPDPPGAGRVRIVRRAGQVEVVGDPGVAEAVADGPHSLRREGDTLVIEGTWPAGPEGVWVEHSPRFTVRWKGDLPRLRVRVNPALPLEVQAQAGSLQVRGMRGPIRASVQAGNATIEGFEGPLELRVQAGGLRASGRLAGGASHIQCDAGSARLALTRDSSVRITAHATLGKIAVEGAEEKLEGLNSIIRDAVIGGGAGTLEIQANLGEVRVTVEP